MERSERKLVTLLALCCSMASAPAQSDSLNRHELPVHAEIAGEPCKFVDPSDPHQIAGPHPAHGNCLTALYPSATPSGTFIGDSMPMSGAMGGGISTSPVTATGPASLSLTTLWLVVAVAMLVLAGINSRKRHRHLPSPGMGGIYDRPGGQLHKHSEGSRWNED